MKKLYRSRDDRMLSGVSGGIAVNLGWNSNIVRTLLIIFVITNFTIMEVGSVDITSGLLVVVIYAVLAYKLKEI